MFYDIAHMSTISEGHSCAIPEENDRFSSKRVPQIPHLHTPKQMKEHVKTTEIVLKMCLIFKACLDLR